MLRNLCGIVVTLALWIAQVRSHNHSTETVRYTNTSSLLIQAAFTLPPTEATAVCCFAFQPTVSAHWWEITSQIAQKTLFVNATSLVTFYTKFEDTGLISTRFQNITNHNVIVTTSSPLAVGKNPIALLTNAWGDLKVSDFALQGTATRTAGVLVTSPAAFYEYRTIDIITAKPVEQNGQFFCGTTSTNTDLGVMYTGINEYAQSAYYKGLASPVKIALQTPFIYQPARGLRGATYVDIYEQGGDLEEYGYLPQAALNFVASNQLYNLDFTGLGSCLCQGPPIMMLKSKVVTLTATVDNTPIDVPTTVPISRPPGPPIPQPTPPPTPPPPSGGGGDPKPPSEKPPGKEGNDNNAPGKPDSSGGDSAALFGQGSQAVVNHVEAAGGDITSKIAVYATAPSIGGGSAPAASPAPIPPDTKKITSTDDQTFQVGETEKRPGNDPPGDHPSEEKQKTQPEGENKDTLTVSNTFSGNDEKVSSSGDKKDPADSHTSNNEKTNSNGDKQGSKEGSSDSNQKSSPNGEKSSSDTNSQNSNDNKKSPPSDGKKEPSDGSSNNSDKNQKNSPDNKKSSNDPISNQQSEKGGSKDDSIGFIINSIMGGSQDNQKQREGTKAEKTPAPEPVGIPKTVDGTPVMVIPGPTRIPLDNAPQGVEGSTQVVDGKSYLVVPAAVTYQPPSQPTNAVGIPTVVDGSHLMVIPGPTKIPLADAPKGLEGSTQVVDGKSFLVVPAAVTYQPLNQAPPLTNVIGVPTVIDGSHLMVIPGPTKVPLADAPKGLQGSTQVIDGKSFLVIPAAVTFQPANVASIIVGPTSIPLQDAPAGLIGSTKVVDGKSYLVVTTPQTIQADAESRTYGSTTMIDGVPFLVITGPTNIPLAGAPDVEGETKYISGTPYLILPGSLTVPVNSAGTYGTKTMIDGVPYLAVGPTVIPVKDAPVGLTGKTTMINGTPFLQVTASTKVPFVGSNTVVDGSSFLVVGATTIPLSNAPSGLKGKTTLIDGTPFLVVPSKTSMGVSATERGQLTVIIDGTSQLIIAGATTLPVNSDFPISGSTFVIDGTTMVAVSGRTTVTGKPVSTSSLSTSSIPSRTLPLPAPTTSRAGGVRLRPEIWLVTVFYIVIAGQ